MAITHKVMLKFHKDNFEVTPWTQIFIPILFLLSPLGDMMQPVSS